MGRTKGGTNKKHTTEEKLAIVLRYLNDHESMPEIQKKTGISNGQISNWVRIYQQKGPEGLERKRGGNPFAALHASKSLTEVERLRLENFKLTLENERLKKGYQVKGVGGNKEYVPTNKTNTTSRKG
jgi:transposase